MLIILIEGQLGSQQSSEYLKEASKRTDITE